MRRSKATSSALSGFRPAPFAPDPHGQVQQEKMHDTATNPLEKTMKILVQLSLAAIFAWSSSVWAADAEKLPKTGFFKKSITPRNLIGDKAAQNLSELFPPDKKLTWQLSVPLTYDPAKPAGVMVFIGPRSWGSGKKEWQKTLEKKNLIWIGLVGGGDKTPVNERIYRAMMARVVVDQDYQIDADRIYLAGLSGGAQIAAMLSTTQPETFKGALFMGIALHWGDKAPPAIELIRQNRFVFMTGSLNKEQSSVKRVLMAYKASGVVNTELIVVPNMNRKMPSNRFFAAAVDFLDVRALGD